MEGPPEAGLGATRDWQPVPIKSPTNNPARTTKRRRAILNSPGSGYDDVLRNDKRQ
jgi:hypothetical protein